MNPMSNKLYEQVYSDNLHREAARERNLQEARQTSLAAARTLIDWQESRSLGLVRTATEMLRSRLTALRITRTTSSTQP